MQDALLNSHSILLADHQAHIVALEYSRDQAVLNHRALAEKLDSLKLWMMSTLAAALAGILTSLFHH